MTPLQVDRCTISQLSTTRSDSDTRFCTDRDVAPPTPESPSLPGPTNQSVDDDLPMPRTYRFAPFGEHLNELVTTPRWQKSLDDHFTNIFKRSVLSECLIDVAAAQALQAIGRLTRTKIRGMAQAVYMHWTRMQFRHKDANISAAEIVTFVSRISDRLGWVSVHAKKDFLDELNCFCIEKLKLTWRWYVAVVIHGVLPISRENMFLRVIAVVKMIGFLFHGGQLQYSVILNGLGYITTMLPWPDAVAIIYVLLHELGPKVALERAGGHFMERLLTDLPPLTAE